MRYEVARALDQVQKAHAGMNAGNRARQKLYHRPSRQRLGEALSFRECLQRFHCTHGKPALLQRHNSSGEDLVVLTSPSGRRCQEVGRIRRRALVIGHVSVLKYIEEKVRA